MKTVCPYWWRNWPGNAGQVLLTITRVVVVAPWSPNGPDSSVCWDVSLPPMTERGHVGSPCESVAFSVSLVNALVHLGTIA